MSGWTLALVIAFGVPFITGTFSVAALIIRGHQQMRRQVQAGRDTRLLQLTTELAPFLESTLIVAREASAASVMTSPEVGDIRRLDQCIDHFESHRITASLARACATMRDLAARYSSLVRMQHQLLDQMRSTGGDAHLGGVAVRHGEQLETFGDRLLVAAEAVRQQVQAVRTQLYYGQA